MLLRETEVFGEEPVPANYNQKIPCGMAWY